MSASDQTFAQSQSNFYANFPFGLNAVRTSSEDFDTFLQSPPSTDNQYMIANHSLSADQSSTLSHLPPGASQQVDDHLKAAPKYATNTDFTDRAALGTPLESAPRKGVQHMLETGLKDLMQIIDRSGRILYVSHSCKTVTGYDREELKGRFVSEYIHPDDSPTLAREFSEAIATGDSFKFYYRFRKGDGAYIILEAHGRVYSTNNAATIGPGTASNQSPVFSIIARPYLTKKSRLRDSFLEHKLENERLTKRIAELKREEEDEGDQQYSRRSEVLTPPDPGMSAYFLYGPYSNGPSGIDSASILASSKPNPRLQSPNNTIPQTATSKSSGPEGNSYLDDVEIMTGLRYRDGERSQGLSLGNPNGALVHTAAPIFFPVDRQDRNAGGNDRKRKMKTTEEYVCMDCGTLSSPEWRRGPNGRKTLCNACGLRWAKQEKRMQTSAAAKALKRKTLDLH
ncbi:hypothetical protein AJ80_01026 [Polytolypa hystricis UAMH7299]|uniref:White collar 2 protein n=1 Tax=Polytolypa hystricis (strain UAMH7299) TaxID=1447883 RepID=A0A2B7Z056_POLH7|nr:hypothetical protein AJ80_01026 [Polytolypa hystricis UAMH7299]